MILIERVRGDEGMLDDVLKAVFKYPGLKSRYSLETHWFVKTGNTNRRTPGFWRQVFERSVQEGEIVRQVLDETIGENESLEQERQGHLREIEKYRNALWELGIDPDRTGRPARRITNPAILPDLP